MNSKSKSNHIRSTINDPKISLEDILDLVEKSSSSWKHAYVIIACLAINHSIRDADIPWTNPRILAVLLADMAQGTSHTISLATKYFVPKEDIVYINKPKPVDLASILPIGENSRYPIIVIEGFDYSLSKRSTAIHSFISSTYDQTPWWYTDGINRFMIPAESMKISMIATASPFILTNIFKKMRLKNIKKYLLLDTLSRMIIIPGRLDLKDSPPLLSSKFRYITKYLRNSPLSREKFRFENNDIKNEVIWYLEQISPKFDNTFIKNTFSRLHHHIIKIAVSHTVLRYDNVINDSDIDFALDLLDDMLPYKIKTLQNILVNSLRSTRNEHIIKRIRETLHNADGPIKVRSLYRKLGITKEKLIRLLNQTFGKKIKFISDGRSLLVCSKLGTERCNTCMFRLQCIKRDSILKHIVSHK
ncbi:MAG: hypothetical protein Q6363_000530 [Candidatus Njordarchaeota archaeon]